MTIDRRSFLKFFGVGVAAAPLMEPGLAYKELIHPSGINLGYDDVPTAARILSDGAGGVGGGPEQHVKSSALKYLTRLRMMTPREHDARMSAFEDVYQLEPQVSSLRSVNMQTKISMSRKLLYWRNVRRKEREAKNYVLGYIDRFYS